MRLHASFLVMLVLAAPAVRAQWSSDPANNLIVADVAGGATQPKIVPTPDGGFYVSWFDNGGDGYDLRVQRLDASGVEQWAHDGVLVADRGYSFNYDYGLSVDAAGNALLSYNCCASDAAEHIAVSKVAPDGTLLWGADGITVSTADEGVYNAYATEVDAGVVVVAWSSDGGVRAQKLDADGNALWIDGGVLLDQPSGAKLLGGVQPGLSGDAIVSWNNLTGSTRILRAQKLASFDGAPLWGGGSALRVFGAGNLQAGYYPPFLADGAGGGVFWDYDAVGVAFVPRVQHLDADGNALLGADGVVATTDAASDHTGTRAIFDAATGDIYAVWRDNYTENLQTFDGVSAQRIDSTGARAWGDAGKVLVAPQNSTDGANAISQVLALPAPDGVIASWVTGAIPAADQPLRASRLDADGNYVWTSDAVDVKTTRYTSRTEGAASANGFVAYAWIDGDEGGGSSTTRAQNVNLDGTLGNGIDDRIFADGFDGAVAIQTVR